MEVIGFPLAVAVLMNQLFPDKFSLNADQSEVRLSNLRIWCLRIGRALFWCSHRNREFL